MPFAGLIVLAITCAIAYQAYRKLNVLRIVMPIAIAFHFYMIMVNMGDDGGLPSISIAFAAFTLLLGFLARPIYSADANEGFYFAPLWDEFFAGLMPPTILGIYGICHRIGGDIRTKSVALSRRPDPSSRT